ncbi:unnamed protein product [Caenorhabditis auriculariae]|uniref:TOG domain-containing protein n=1 Tax=Caenorhabditis auriculariae TaxID=2777116 RepID=A0A8S1HIC8_9PELO|nr:unnamed protein product [Caenorhabditis auriculariae]
MDEWTFLDEVDVLSKWPAEHRKVVTEGGKWSERRDALEALNKLMEENPRLSTTSLTIYGELMDELRKILDRESNIVVVSTAARTAELLAQGPPISDQKIKRQEEKNVRDAVSSALFAVSQTTIPERIQKDLMEGMALPSPEVKQTLLEFIYKYCKFLDAVDVPFFKAVTPLVVKMASDSDVTVRDKACAALGSIRRLLGPGAAAFLGPIATDNAKMEKGL